MSFEHELDLSAYLADELVQQGVPGKYRLSGIVVHSGRWDLTGHNSSLSLFNSRQRYSFLILDSILTHTHYHVYLLL